MRAAPPASIIAAAAAAVLAGCAGAAQPADPPINSGLVQAGERSFLAPLARPAAVAAGLTRLRLDATMPIAGTRAQGRLHDLYVADYGVGAIVLLNNKGYTFDSRITAGISGPEADDLDATGNLYVANAATDDITEYAPGASSPSFTYSSGMIFPVNLTVDRHGNVLEADYGDQRQRNIGFINEYAQRSDTILQSCPTPGRTEGVAVDPAGDVFVSYNTRFGGRFAEYKGGLQGCTAIALHVHAFSAGGIALDKSADLIVVDQAAGRVKVFPPPYRHDQRRLGSQYYDPFHVRIDRRNGLAFVTDPGNAVVYVIDYATGRIAEQLDYSNAGFTIPFDAVDGPNAVY